MIVRWTLAAALVAALLMPGAVLAQTTAAPTGAPAPKAAPQDGTPAPKARKAMTPASAACYAQADKQNLHGKARKAFHRTCMKQSKG